MSMFQKNMKNSKFVSMRYCFGKEYKILKIAKFYQSNIALETFMFFTSFLIVVPNIAHGVIEIGHITKAVIDNIIIEIIN